MTASMLKRTLPAGAHPILPVAPENQIAAAIMITPITTSNSWKYFPSSRQFLSEFHTEPPQSQAPRPRSEEGVEVESPTRHPRNPAGSAMNVADHRNRSSDEDCQRSPAREAGPVKFTAAHQNPASVAFHQWSSAVAPDLVGDKRAAGRSRSPHRSPPQNRLNLPGRPGIPQGHDQFRRQRGCTPIQWPSKWRCRHSQSRQ